MAAAWERCSLAHMSVWSFCPWDDEFSAMVWGTAGNLLMCLLRGLIAESAVRSYFGSEKKAGTVKCIFWSMSIIASGKLEALGISGVITTLELYMLRLAVTYDGMMLLRVLMVS